MMSNDDNDEAYMKKRRGGRRGRRSAYRTMAPLYHETHEEKEAREHFEFG